LKPTDKSTIQDCGIANASVQENAPNTVGEEGITQRCLAQQFTFKGLFRMLAGTLYFLSFR